MGAKSILSTAARWVFQREDKPEDPIVEGINIMTKFKENGELQDQLASEIEDTIRKRDESARAAVEAEAKRLELEARFVQVENDRDGLYDKFVEYIGTLSPLPEIVVKTIEEQKRKAAAEAEAKAKADEEAEAARKAAADAAAAEDKRLADEAAAEEAKRLEAAAKAARDQQLADEAAAREAAAIKEAAPEPVGGDSGLEGSAGTPGGDETAPAPVSGDPQPSSDIPEEEVSDLVVDEVVLDDIVTDEIIVDDEVQT